MSALDSHGEHRRVPPSVCEVNRQNEWLLQQLGGQLWCMWSEICFIVRVCFVFVSEWLDPCTISAAIQRKRLKLIAPSALRYIHAFVHRSTETHAQRARAHTHTRMHWSFKSNDSSLWEEQNDGGLQQLISPDAQLLRDRRRKPAAQSILKESASSGLLAQSAAGAVVALCTQPEEGWKVWGLEEVGLVRQGSKEELD